MLEFAASVEEWARKANVTVDKAMLAIAEDALARVKELTPVRTGNLRANWTIVPLGEEAPKEATLTTAGVGMGAGFVAQKGAERAATNAAFSAAKTAAAGNLASAVAYAGVTYAAGETTAGGALGSIAGQFAGTTAGAKAGALLGGSVAGAPGALVGGVVGGFVGGFGGSMAGEMGGKAIEQQMAGPPKGYSIVNVTVYAPYIEYGYQRRRKDGSVVQVEGRHMMQQTVAELPSIAAKTLARLRDEEQK